MSSRTTLLRTTGMLLALPIAACTAPDDSRADLPDEALGTGESAVVCDEVSGTDIQRSLAVTDPTILARFSFKRTMNALRTTADVASTETSLGVYQRWMKSFTNKVSGGSCDDARVDPNDYGLPCPRDEVAKLATVNPFLAAASIKFVPVALFNRFDLTPSSGATCGEYRIVYGMQLTDPSPVTGRGLIIFEGSLANPNPAAGVDGCLPVAQFWQSLSSDPDVTSRASKLEDFYFTGGAVPGFGPVVTAQSYGLSSNSDPPKKGQIRTNFFIDRFQWHLREFKTHRTCADAADPSTCKLDIRHVTVKVNPAEELFSGTHAKSAAFRDAFVPQVQRLAAATTTGIGMSVATQYDEWESLSEDGAFGPLLPRVRYSSFANATIRGQIGAELTRLGSPLSVDNILERATTQTCAGCHEASNGKDLGGGLTWPSSNRFTHVEESGVLSKALTTTFLPHRKEVLEAFINARCSGAPVALPDGTTVGGSDEDAAN